VEVSVDKQLKKLTTGSFSSVHTDSSLYYIDTEPGVAGSGSELRRNAPSSLNFVADLISSAVRSSAFKHEKRPGIMKDLYDADTMNERVGAFVSALDPEYDNSAGFHFLTTLVVGK
jgi:hypothetical protein